MSFLGENLAHIDLTELLGALQRASNGLAIEELAAAFEGRASRRTLQRYLAQMVADGRLRRVGQRRGARYFAGVPLPAYSGDRYSVQEPAPPSYGGNDEPDTARFTAEVYVPTSAEGALIKAAIRQPRHLRKPVGYEIRFLEQYTPNQSAYLPQALRDQLHAMGRASATLAPAGTFARDILQRLLIDLSWASSQLEGNTYSRLDTQRLIELGQAAEGKDALETQMILNHKQAIEYLVHGSVHANLSVQTILELHALLSDGLLADPAACGRIRRRAVEIGGSVYMPIALPQRLDELLAVVVQMAGEIADPFEQSYFLMVHLPYLQPFEDVNKRVSRLAANIPFIAHNLCPLSFVDVPQQAYVDAMLGVYELNRVELLRDVFVWAYERSCQQYVAVKQALVPPDIFRLRHRVALGEVIAKLVRKLLPPTHAAVSANLPSSVAEAEREAFIALALNEFKTLHAGNAVRFGIRPLELKAWQEQTAQAAPSQPD